MAVLTAGVLTTINIGNTLKQSLALYYANIPSAATQQTQKDGFTAINTDLANLAGDGWQVLASTTANGAMVWTLGR